MPASGLVLDLEDARLIFAHRLREARLRAGLTQEALGVAAGVAPDVARTRINRYEKGVNECDLRTAQRLSEALEMPLAAFFANDDDLQDLIILYSKLPTFEQRLLLSYFKQFLRRRNKKEVCPE